ncbi:MAG: sugar ABC transporter permease [Clostridia bacterium]|nr:sugar ABC transporter permease [Clostridia bacterium]MBQ8973519.1 sugar ABC transporter permease [Clostridia bacterium]
MLAGVALVAVFVALNRDLLYSQKVAPYVFVAPFIITFVVFFAYPLISTILMSFQEITGSGTSWIGFKNYTDMFSNKNFYTAVKNSVIYMVLTCAILIPIPMLLAYLAESKLSKVGGLFKTIAFMPVLCSVVVAGIIFRMMFSELDGALMNQVRKLLGQEPIIWLKTAWGSMFAMVLLCFWRWTGMNMLYYMAGLKSISNELYEAADIDGANSVQKFTKICLPLLKPTTIYVLTISIYAGLSMFTESYMIFGGNNSPKNYGLTIVGYLYRYGFEKVDKFGFASAVGLVLMLGSLIITIIQLRITGVIGKKED